MTQLIRYVRISDESASYLGNSRFLTNNAPYDESDGLLVMLATLLLWKLKAGQTSDRRECQL